MNARAGTAAFAGLALALAFPLPGWAGLAWVGPGLFLAAAAGTTGGRSFRLGWLGGFVAALVALRWLLAIPFPAGAVAGWLALSAYVALFPGAWVWLCVRLLNRLSGVPRQRRAGRRRTILETVPWQMSKAMSTGTVAGSEREGRNAAADPVIRAAGLERPDGESWVEKMVALGWSRRSLWALTCAVAWVAVEMVQARLLSGFPWNLLGVSQYRVGPLIQVAAVTGVYGVSFLVAWVSAAGLCAGTKLAARLGRFSPGELDGPEPATRWAPSRVRPGLGISFRLALFTDLAFPLVLVLLVGFAGGMKLVRPAAPARELRVALVQPSIPQTLIFDPAEATNRFRAVMELSQLAAATRPDVLIWPEASLPDFSEASYRALTNFVATNGFWMILGADDVVERPGGRSGASFEFYNSAFLVSPQGRFVSTYRKQRLVIFGEYIPLADTLPFLKHLTPIQGSFSAGPGPVTFELESPQARISPLICFEDVFPHGVRRHVEADTDFLLDLTNNGWFGEGAAQWQHAAAAVFRAVENGLPLVRCTNNGLTCWIDAGGQIRDFGLGDAHEVYGPGFAVYRIPLRSDGRVPGPTFYRERGDVFGWACVLGAAGALAWGVRRRRPGAGPAAVDKARLPVS